MKDILLKGHKVTKGRAEGQALVSLKPISFMGGVDPESGMVTEKDHPLEGIRLSQKILVFPVGKGSSLGSYRLYEMARCRTQPAGIINVRADPVVVAGAIIANIPMVDQLDEDPFKFIKPGDYVTLDADQGLVIVKPTGEDPSTDLGVGKDGPIY